MANISTREQLTALDRLDLGFVQDVSDVSEGASGKSKKMELKDLIILVHRMVGQVKVIDGNGVKPSHNHTGASSVEQVINYATPLTLAVSPTTTFPPMDTVADETSVWDDANSTFLENKMLGQVHLWRLIFNYNKNATGKKNLIRLRLYNALSGFSISNEHYLSEEADAGSFVVIFETIADSASLPTPLGTGQGYQVATSMVGDAGSDIDVELDSITRSSLAAASTAV